MTRDPGQLQVIASPGRDEIIDAVSIIGPCTISELAEFLGRSRNGLYYHIRALRDCGIFLESFQTGGGKQRTARYDALGRPIIVYFDLATPKSRKAVLQLAHARVRTALRGFRRALRPDVAVVEGPGRNVWASRWTGWLSDSELKKVNCHFSQLTALFHKTAGQPSSSRRYHELTFVLAPVVPEPVQRLPRRLGRPAPTNRRR
jgi:hypothetical protein